jgi:tetratricopeptide (TPR) repeat protein
MVSDADESAVILRVQDLKPEEAEQLRRLRAESGWTNAELSMLVQGWYGSLGPHVSARLSSTPGQDDVLVITFAPPPKEHAVTATKHYERAVELAQMGRLLEALHHFEHAVRLYPIHPDYQMGLGHAHLELGHLDLAETAFLACLRVDPEHFDAMTLLGNVYLALGKLDLAGELYQRSISQVPTVQAMTNLGAVHGKMGRLHEARASFSRALQLDPTYKQARMGLQVTEQMLKDGA